MTSTTTTAQRSDTPEETIAAHFLKAGLNLFGEDGSVRTSSYAKALAKVLDVAEKAGRDPNTIVRAYWANWYREREWEIDGGRRIFTGSPEQVAEDIGWLKEAGVVHVLVSFLSATLSETLDRMERFATEVIPRVGD